MIETIILINKTDECMRDYNDENKYIKKKLRYDEFNDPRGTIKKIYNFQSYNNIKIYGLFLKRGFKNCITS